MAVDIGIRIKAKNTTGRDFDKLIDDLKKTRKTTDELKQRLASLRAEQLSTGNSSDTLRREINKTRAALIKSNEATREQARSLRAAERAKRDAHQQLAEFRSTLRNAAITAGIFTAGMVAIGKSVIDAAVRMEGIRNGLTALEGSAEAAEARIASLREVIREPGVGYQAAVQAAVELKAVNVEAELANRTIREFGNSLALVGRTDLRLTLLGLRQILSRGRVSQEELNQITERSSLVSAVLRDKFGTVLSEDIQAQINAAGKSITDGFLIPILDGLEQLDRAPIDSALNSIQNLQNSTFELKASLGDVLLPTFSAIVQKITDMVGAFNNMDDRVKTAIVTIGAVVTGLGALVTVGGTVGFVLASLNAALLTSTGVTGFAGLAAILAPAGPVLLGLGAVAVAVAPVIVALNNAANAAREASERSRDFATQINDTAKSLESGRGLDKRISELKQYRKELDLLILQEKLVQLVIGGGTNPIDTVLRTSGLAENDVTREARSRGQVIEGLIKDVEAFRESGQRTIEQVREFDRLVASSLREAQLKGDTEAIKLLESAAALVVEEFKRLEDANIGVATSSTKAITQVRNYSLELVELDHNLRNAADAFRSSENIEDVTGSTQKYLDALHSVTQVKRDQIEAELALEGAALARLANAERADSEHAVKIRNLSTELLRLNLDYESEKSRITREETEKRTQIEEEYAQRVEEYNKRVSDARRRFLQERSNDIQSAARFIRDIEDEEQRNISARQFGQRLTQGVSPKDALQQVKQAIKDREKLLTLTTGLGRALERGNALIPITAGIINRDLNRGVRTAAELWKVWGDNIEASQEKLRRFERAGIIADLQARGQILEDQGILTLTATGQPSTTEDTEIPQVSDIQRRVVEQTGNIVSSVPFDVVDAISNSVQLRRDGNAEILRLEQESAAEIKLIQESVTLSAKNKASAIERIERQSALERIRIENAVSARQRESFQSVVTNFLSGIARMIAAEAQLALARRATSGLRSLFGGAAAVGGAGLATGVLLPLLGGLGLAYGASQLISRSSPSAEVYQRSQYGAVGGSGEGTVPNVQPSRGTSRAEQEGGLPMLEANINVSVEASGTRLGQANAREQLKTERWGG